MLSKEEEMSYCSPLVTVLMAPPSEVMLLKRAVKGVRAAGLTEGGLPLKALLRNSTGARLLADAVKLLLSV